MAVLPLVALGVGLAGTGLSAFGQMRAGQAEKAGYDYNAMVAESEAGVARAGAAREEEIHRAKLQRMLGTQRALYGAAGVDITSGSPLLTMMSTAEEGEREAEFIKYGGEVEATRAMNEAQLQRFYGKGARTAGMLGAGSTFLTGLGSAGLSLAKMGGLSGGLSGRSSRRSSSSGSSDGEEIVGIGSVGSWHAEDELMKQLDKRTKAKLRQMRKEANTSTW